MDRQYFQEHEKWLRTEIGALGTRTERLHQASMDSHEARFTLTDALADAEVATAARTDVPGDVVQRQLDALRAHKEAIDTLYDHLAATTKLISASKFSTEAQIRRLESAFPEFTG